MFIWMSTDMIIEGPWMTDKDLTERRVHVLPKELLQRLRAHQERMGISSEVEAVRRLLDKALQMEDTVIDILNKLKANFVDEKDLRVLARDVLSTHVLVRRMNYEDNSISFDLADGSGGKINSDGKIFTNDGSSDYWTEIGVPSRQRSARGGAPSWDAPKGGDLDDEIPF
jgi:hypothetical protein